MPRRARVDAPGVVHHVTVRGIERRRIFYDALDREDFLARLGRILPECEARCLAWALMPNHVHLVVATGAEPLARVMARVNTGYARGFNLRYDRVGHVFQNRYHSELVDDDPYCLAAVRYVHLNPLRAGLVPSLQALARYPWTGHAALMGAPRRAFHDCEAVLAQFAPDSARARRRLTRWMSLALGDDEPAVGDEPMSAPPEPTQPHAFGRPSRIAPGRPSDWVAAWRMRDPDTRIRAALALVETHTGLGFDRVCGRERRRGVADARAAAVYVSTGPLGVGSLHVAHTLGITRSTVSRIRERGARVAAGWPELRPVPATPALDVRNERNKGNESN